MEVALFVGAQGSGKTSFYAAELVHTHLRISQDLVRTKHRQRRLFETALHLTQPLVLDNTNATRALRAPWIAAAREQGVPVVGYWFDVPLAEVLARNAAREPARQIPVAGVKTTYRLLEPPTVDEGFERVIVVRVPTSPPGMPPRFEIDLGDLM